MTAGARDSLTIAGTRLVLVSGDPAELQIDATVDLAGLGTRARVGAERDCERDLELGDAVRAGLARAERSGASSVALAVPAHDGGGRAATAAHAADQAADVIVGTVRAFLAPGSKLERVVLCSEDGALLETFAGELDRHRRDLEKELAT